MRTKPEPIPKHTKCCFCLELLTGLKVLLVVIVLFCCGLFVLFQNSSLDSLISLNYSANISGLLLTLLGCYTVYKKNPFLILIYLFIYGFWICFSVFLTIYFIQTSGFKNQVKQVGLKESLNVLNVDMLINFLRGGIYATMFLLWSLQSALVWNLQLVDTFDLQELNNGLHMDRLLKTLREVGIEFEPTVKDFFNHSVDTKSKYGYDLSIDAGWLNIAGERLNQQSSFRENKEAFNIRPSLPLNLPPGFETDTVKQFIQESYKVRDQVLRAYAQCLKIDDVDYFVKRHNPNQPSGTVLRSLFYPPIETEETQNMIRAGGHSDFGSITLLFTEPNDPGGLEIVQPGTIDTFVPVTSVKSQIIVNTGDLLEYWTGSYFRSTIHRVVLPASSKLKQARYSIAFFNQPEATTPLTVIPSPILTDARVNLNERQSSAYEDFAASKIKGNPSTAGEHLRLRINHVHGL
ncbi:hypothetical protein BC833DRAFT_654329 [Globomyces pollinis-pini]|nr:hypothetical protein BC833DRAFT_654329 [Globomyces pollinis-pini]